MPKAIFFESKAGHAIVSPGDRKLLSHQTQYILQPFTIMFAGDKGVHLLTAIVVAVVVLFLQFLPRGHQTLDSYFSHIKYVKNYPSLSG